MKCRCDIDPPYDVCKDCGERVIATITRRGKKMPVDSEPSATGSVLMHEEGGIVHSRSIAYPPQTIALERACRHQSHYYTCKKNQVRRIS